MAGGTFPGWEARLQRHRPSFDGTEKGKEGAREALTESWGPKSPKKLIAKGSFLGFPGSSPQRRQGQTAKRRARGGPDNKGEIGCDATLRPIKHQARFNLQCCSGRCPVPHATFCGTGPRFWGDVETLVGGYPKTGGSSLPREQWVARPPLDRGQQKKKRDP